MANNSPLVSIIVLCYNSADYVIETLESAKNQTYQNIELIISDDGSSDDTIDLCKKWLRSNDGKFVHSEIIAAPSNTGIPANCNRGLYASSGEWIKLIAGDDALLKECIETNVNYIVTYKEVKFLQTISNLYDKAFLKENFISKLPQIKNPDFFEQSGEDQYKMLLNKNYIAAPSVFMHKDSVLSMGGFDEDFRYFEDITLWLEVTKNGEKFYFLEKETVNYRKHLNTSEKASKPHMGQHYAKELLKFRKKYVYKESNALSKIKYASRLHLIIFLDKVGLNNNSAFVISPTLVTLKSRVFG